jgi:hypothetical protein
MDRLEREVTTMLRNKAAALPLVDDVGPDVARRVAKRRTAKMIAAGAAAGVVVAATAVGVASVLNSTGSQRPPVAVSPTTPPTTVGEPGLLPVTEVDAIPCRYDSTPAADFDATPFRLPVAATPETLARTDLFVIPDTEWKLAGLRVLAPKGWVCTYWSIMPTGSGGSSLNMVLHPSDPPPPVPATSLPWDYDGPVIQIHSVVGPIDGFRECFGKAKAEDSDAECITSGEVVDDDGTAALVRDADGSLKLVVRQPGSNPNEVYSSTVKCKLDDRELCDAIFADYKQMWNLPSDETEPPVITLTGKIGGVQLGESSDDDVVAEFGPGDATATWPDAGGTREIDVRGYDCAPTESPTRDAIDDGTYCTTAFYFDASTGLLIDFVTGSTDFVTERGTRVGATAAEAERLEGVRVTPDGCSPAILLRGSEADPSILIYPSGASPTDRVVQIQVGGGAITC